MHRRPSRRCTTSPAWSKTLRCCDTAGRDTSRPSASLPTESGRFATRSKIVRRVVSASAAKPSWLAIAYRKHPLTSCAMSIWKSVRPGDAHARVPRGRSVDRERGAQPSVTSVSPPCDRCRRAPRFLSLQMQLALCSVCTVLALATGCMTDDTIFLQGDVPSFGQAGGNGTDCELGANGEPPAVERDARPA